MHGRQHDVMIVEQRPLRHNDSIAAVVDGNNAVALDVEVKKYFAQNDAHHWEEHY